MKFLLLGLLTLLSLLYALLYHGFQSFSLLSLVRYIRDKNIKSFRGINFQEKHRDIGNSIAAAAFTFQLVLLFDLYFLTRGLFPAPPLRAGILVALFLLIFGFLVPMVSYWKGEILLKRILFLARLPWALFYPLNRLFFALLVPGKEKPGIRDPKLLTEKELEIFIEEGRREGVIEKEDKKMIESILEFGDILVKEIMTPRVEMRYVRITDSIDDLIAVIRREKRSRYPVIKDKIDHIVGVIISKDIYNYIDRQEEFKVESILRPAYFIPETMRILVLLNEMQKRKQKFAVVLDEFGGVAGIITVEDIVEEIVGEIYDEFDKKEDGIFRKKDHFIVRGDTEITQINERLKIGLNEDEDYKTISGLLSFKLGRIPKESDIISENNFVFEVLRTDHNQVKQVRIYRDKK